RDQRVLRAQRLPARRRPRLLDLRDPQSRRRGARQRLDVPRPDAVRASGDVGGLARGLPADAAVRVVAPPRRVRGAGMTIEQGDLRLLESETAQRLLASTTPARIAYTALDG